MSEQLLDEERQAYEHSVAGDLDAAISGWTAILDDPTKKAFFAEGGDEEDPQGPVREIAASLADAYLRKGGADNRERAMALVRQYGLELTSDGQEA